MSGSISVQLEAGIATVTLDAPPANAVDETIMGEIRDAFRSLDENKEVRAAIFAAAGDRAFMAGLNLRPAARRGVSDDHMLPSRVIDPSRVIRDAMWAITDCAVPVIGAINGPALGGGLAFVSFCRHPDRGG